MMEERAEGIVLRSLDYKERERIITVLTKEMGIISLIAKRMTQGRSHLVALTTPFTHAEFLFRKGRSELMPLIDGTLLSEHRELRSSYASLQSAGQLLQMILLSQFPGKPAPALYALLLAYLGHLPTSKNRAGLASSFFLKLLKHEGLFPIENPGFSPTEWETVQILVATTSFAKLRELPVAEPLCAKIQKFCERVIKG
jgi:DNA repair protein RecO (recombination protein O)